MRIFSGIQPTGAKHLGNYIGAIRQYVDSQDRGEAFICIVDLHSVTVAYEPDDLRESTLSLAALLIASGLDPDRCTLFVQSHNPDHPNATWLLSPVASFGELRRMTQFKDKAEQQEFVSVGLFTYPVLQAADILLRSGAEVLRAKSFDELSETERIAADHVIRALAVHLPTRRSRRYRPSPYGRRFDQRRTLRASLRTQGEPFRRAWRDRRRRVRPLVLILDVSGSMSAYSRALMQFGFAAMRAGRRVEVFCFGTRLTRVTRALARSEPDDALREVAAAVVDWNGGTRIGASLKELLDRWSQHASMRGAVVVLCSDGLERGEPALLAAQVARLSRLSHRLIWVNPLKGSPRYEPLARGMAAALPHVDVFLAGHNLESLESLCEVLEGAR